jgi:hypothetical protein
LGLLDGSPGGIFNPQPGEILSLRCPDGTFIKYTVPPDVPMFTDLADACEHDLV